MKSLIGSLHFLKHSSHLRVSLSFPTVTIDTILTISVQGCPGLTYTYASTHKEPNTESIPCVENPTISLVVESQSCSKGMQVQCWGPQGNEVHNSWLEDNSLQSASIAGHTYNHYPLPLTHTYHTAITCQLVVRLAPTDHLHSLCMLYTCTMQVMKGGI